MLNWTLRYLPVVAMLDDLRARRVLDVGSGWHGLGWYRSGLVVQTDLDFAGEPPRGAPVADVRYVCASADRLPFKDGAFDFVVSLDLIEHLPADLRGVAVQELIRVASRGVLVGFPVGPDAAMVDRRLARSLTFARREVPRWLAEHVDQTEYPDASTVAAALPRHWHIEWDRGLGNTTLLLAVSVAEQLPGAQRVAGRIDEWYRRRGPLEVVDRGRTYRRLWLLTPLR